MALWLVSENMTAQMSVDYWVDLMELEGWHWVVLLD